MAAVSVFFNMLFEKMTSDNLMRLVESAGISSDLKELEKIIAEVQGWLVDAEQKHMTDLRIQEWIDALQHLAYQIDDLLDDFAIEGHHYSSTCTSNNMVLKIIPTTFANCTSRRTIMYGSKLICRLKEITSKLHELSSQNDALGLNFNMESSYHNNRRLELTSFVDDSEIMGADKEALLKLLLGDAVPHNQNISVVSVLGMGGTGKTTLARLLYNERKVNDHFELQAWVYVSQVFNEFNISKAIFQSVSGEEKTFVNLDMLQVALTERLSNKKFLIVLDDVWNQDKTAWELLLRPFVVGAPGSKILVTTRMNLASVLSCNESYHMGNLSNQEALSLFAQYALGEQNFDSHPELKLSAEAIIKKCYGLPLILKTFGRLLRRKKNVEEWEEFLHHDARYYDYESETIQALRLRYNDLPPQLKQMFAYCYLFPKAYVFNTDELVKLWMAEGFLYQSNGNKSVESFGRECFQELISRSFFRDSTHEKSGYIMHDLLIDVAKSVGREFFCTLDHDMNVDYENGALEKAHHLSFIRQEFGVFIKFKALLRARHLRTLLAVSTSLDSRKKFFLSNQVLMELLPQLKFLRVLNLSNYSITEVPQSIGSLKHIRYLNFSKTDITSLPEQVGDLYHLQSLLLRHCEKLFSLPNSLVNLINLRHLDIRDTPRLNKIPAGIGELTSLQTLSKVICEGVNGFNISELNKLDLRGRLSIEGLHNVKNEIEGKQANLPLKKDLDDLEMEWNDDFDESSKRMNEYHVLETLKPHYELKKLKILFYGGVEFPGWVGDPTFSCLTELTLRGCRRCSKLPTLGHLKSLQKLFVESMNEVKIVGSELLVSDNSCNGISFPLLELLAFKDMQGWETWSMGSDVYGGTTASFPCLREISILNCPKLSEVSIKSIPSLGVLHIKRCSKAAFRSMVGSSSSIARLTMENIKELTQLDGDIIEHLRALEYLCIKECDKLKYLWESELKSCKILTNLWKLEVHYCKELVSVGEKKSNLGISLDSLKHVDLRNCKRLEHFSCPNSIEKLEIFDCPSISSLTFPTIQEHPSSLTILDIRRCDNLDESWLLNNFLSSLTYLEMDRFPKVRLLPEGYLVNLTRLIIRGCDNIESIPDNGFGFFPSFA